jgi:hypothetical protein
MATAPLEPAPARASQLAMGGAGQLPSCAAGYTDAMSRRVLHLYPDWGAEDCPLWFTYSRGYYGNASADELGLSLALRADLRAWNDAFELASAAEESPDSDSHEGSSALDAFELAARVQLEMGDGVDVWCGETLDPQHFPRVITVRIIADAPGASIERGSQGEAETIPITKAGGGADTARALVAWRQLTKRAGEPFGDAVTRAEGLRVAGRIQNELGRVAVAFHSGARRERDYGNDPMRAEPDWVQWFADRERSR